MSYNFNDVSNNDTLRLLRILTLNCDSQNIVNVVRKRFAICRFLSPYYGLSKVISCYKIPAHFNRHIVCKH